jgi:hypothetical protein
MAPLLHDTQQGAENKLYELLCYDSQIGHKWSVNIKITPTKWKETYKLVLDGRIHNLC